VRRWGYRVKKIPADKARIIVCSENFHGRTTTIVSASSDPHYRADFGPFTPGFVLIPFGDADALEEAITPHTAAFLVEPIQCEGGVLIPPAGYLKDAYEICQRNNVLFVADEIQTGLGRTGRMFASEWEGVRPDMMIVGKALSGGVYPVSAMLADTAIMDVFEPGSHGSTFGGNPLAAAIGRAALRVLVDEKLADRAQNLGSWFLGELKKIASPHVQEVRGRGLMIGVEIKTASGKARPFCEELAKRGILCKETHDQVIRFAPPLVVEKEALAWVVGEVKEVLA
jgi:ornithine--oxo-acid transaminase